MKVMRHDHDRIGMPALHTVVRDRPALPSAELGHDFPAFEDEKTRAWGGIFPKHADGDGRGLFERGQNAGKTSCFLGNLAFSLRVSPSRGHLLYPNSLPPPTPELPAGSNVHIRER